MYLISYRVKTNNEVLEKLTEKPFVAVTPPKLSPPAQNKFTPLADLLGVYLGVLSQINL